MPSLTPWHSPSPTRASTPSSCSARCTTSIGAPTACALGEARRVVRPGGPVFVAAISRWAAGLYGVLTDQLHLQLPEVLNEVDRVEHDGVLRPLFPGSFNGFCHRPRQLAAEVRAARLDLVDLVAVEGATAIVAGLDARMADPREARVVLDAALATERVPELLGVGPHLHGRRPPTDR
ncbi:MAG: hypothetical protein H0W46_11835 [Acidimicrobiia bacterium]|nr:hypothetical protein [Acidimicrobiia bacterium]